MKVPGDPQYPQHGRVLIDPDPLNPARTSTPFDNGAGLDYPGHFLLDFINETRLRMDVVLDNAHSLTVRQVSQKVNGVDCYVLDFVSKYGRGTLWLDPDDGYNIAQAEFPVKARRLLYRLPAKYCARCARTFTVNPPSVLPKRPYGNQPIAQAAALHYLHGFHMSRRWKCG